VTTSAGLVGGSDDEDQPRRVGVIESAAEGGLLIARDGVPAADEQNLPARSRCDG
jgi:hypothetical protein